MHMCVFVVFMCHVCFDAEFYLQYFATFIFCFIEIKPKDNALFSCYLHCIKCGSFSGRLFVFVFIYYGVQ